MNDSVQAHSHKCPGVISESTTSEGNTKFQEDSC
jgi:hypothetical protein